MSAATDVQLTVGSSAESGDVDLERRYAQVASEIGGLADGSDVRIALDVPGLDDELGPVASNVSLDATNHTITFSAGSLAAELAGGATSAGVVVDWDSGTDISPTVVAVLRDDDGTTLGALEPRWPDDDDTGLERGTVALAASDATLAGAGLSDAGRDLLDMPDDGALDAAAGATLSGVYERGSVQAIDDVLDPVAADESADAWFAGPLTSDVTHLVAGGDPTGDAAAFSPEVRAPGLPVATWVDARSSAVRHTLEPGAGDTLVATRTRVESVDVAGNTFEGEDVLGDQGTNLVLRNVGTFLPPFGTAALLPADLSDVELTLTNASGVLGGSIGFTLPIGDGTRVEMALETEGDRVAGALTVSDQVGLGELVDWLSTRPTFGGLAPGVPTETLDRVQLTTAELSVVSDTEAVTFSAYAEASVALVDDPVAFEVLTSVRAPKATGSTPTALVSFRAGGDGTTLGQVLPVPDGPVADLELPKVTLLAALPTTFDASPDDLGERANAYLTDVFGADLDDPLAIGPGLTVRAEVAVATFGDDVAEALGWDPDGDVVLEGTVGLDLSGLLKPAAPGDPPTQRITSLGLSAEIPNGGAPAWLPDFMAWPTGGTWNLDAEYTAGEGFSLSAGLAGAKITLPGDDSEVGTDLSAGFTKNTEGIEITLSAALSDWTSPYGVEWLTVDELKLDVKIVKPAAPAPDPGGTPQPAPAADVSVGFAGKVDVSGKKLELGIEVASGAEGTNATIRLALLDTVTIAEIADLLGVDIGEYDALVGSLGFGPGELVVTTGGGAWHLETVVRLSWDPYGEGDPIAAKFLLDVNKPAAQGGVTPVTRVAFGIQPDEEVTLNSFLPDSLSVPIDVPLAFPDDPDTDDVDEGYTIGFVYTNAAFNPLDDDTFDEDSLTRRWFEPLFAEGETSTVAVGGGMFGALPLPEDVAEMLESLGIGDEVQLKGRLPLGTPSAASQLSLSLGMRIDPSILPTVVDSAGLSLELSVAATSVSMELQGDITLAIEQGLRGDEARRLRDIGVDEISPVAQDFDCPNGGVTKQIGNSFYCHDLLTIQVSAEVEASTDGASVSISANVVTGRPGEPADGWRPYGIDWIVLRQLQATLALEVDPAGVSIDLGIGANVDVVGKNLSGAISIGLRPIPGPPFLAVEFNGLRVAAPDGLSIGDVISVVNTLVDGDADLSNTGLPDIGLRNLSFSLSPLGVPELCIAQGLRLQADLYVDPSADVHSDPTPVCDPDAGVPVRPGPSTSCADRRDEGCFAGILLDISDQGIIGQGSVAPFDLGPIKWKGGEIDFELTKSNQRLHVEGAGEISVGSAKLVEGELQLDFTKTKLTYYGSVKLASGLLNVFVDGETQLGFFNGEPTGMRLHVLVATSTAQIGNPSLGQSMIDSLTADLQRLNTLVDGLDNVLRQWEAAGGNATQIITELPTILRNAGVSVPGWVDSIANKIKEIDKADVLGVVDFLVDAALNGVTIDLGEVCFGALGCVDLGSITVPGLCDGLFPNAKVGGRCSIPSIARTYITPLFRDAIRATVTGLQSLDGSALDSVMRTLFDGIGKVIRLDCAEFETAIGPGVENKFDLAVRGAIFGQDVGLTLGITPSDFQGLDGRIDEILADLITNLSEGANLPNCQGYRSDLFGAGVSDPEAPVVPNLTVLTDSVAEAGTARARVQLQGGVSGERQLQLRWGDGTVDSVSVGAAAKVFTHVYDDDDPTATTADNYTVTIKDGATGREATDNLSVVNTAPSISASFDETVDEGGTASIDIAVTDPGDDRQELVVTWGDGESETVAMPRGAKQGSVATVEHKFPDDNPGGTAEDPMTATVSVVDDDLGFATTTANLTVRNVAPVLEATDDVVIEEGADGLVTLDAGFTDVGREDVHVYTVDWGDGDAIDLTTIESTGGRGAVTDSHRYGDDGVFTVTLGVADDDLGSATDSFTVTVGNVAPTLDIQDRIDNRNWVLADGIDADTAIDVPTMLTTSSSWTDVKADLDDPGSDDLTTRWTWDDGNAADANEHLVNPPATDPDPSTSVQPRDLVDTTSRRWTAPCLYQVAVDVADDDGGTDSDSAWVLVTGSNNRANQPWRSRCYLRAVDHMSVVFGSTPDSRAVTTTREALEILNVGQRAQPLDHLDKALLKGWFELVRGGMTWNEGVDIDGNRRIDTTFGSFLRSTEKLRNTPGITRSEITRRTAILLNIIR